MNVKTFEAFSMKDAVAAVRREFGPDAVILNSKEKIAADGKGKLIQVTAAAPTSTRKGGSVINERNDDDLREVVEYIKSVEKRMDGMLTTIATRENLQAVESGMEELKSLVLETLRQQCGGIQEGMKEPIQRIYHALKTTGLDDVHLVALCRHLENVKVRESQDADGDFYEIYREEAAKWLLKRVKIAPLWTEVAGAPVIQVFVGTTGVGKSSSVVKLASHLSRKQKRKVLLVSFDNVRLAASEQMRVYAKVLGVEFEQIEDAMDLSSILSRHSDVDVVLVDTAGRSPKRSQKMEDLLALKSLNLPLEFHLVMPATEKEEQLDRTIRAFSRLGLSSLIFTKLDETWSYGELFNLMNRWSLPLSYFGIGQNVPEDLERATRERVVERLVGM